MSRTLEARERAVRAALVAWDPLSVFYPLTPGDDTIDSIRDEYDDLVWPLLGRLQRGESLVQIVEWIEVMMRDDYGIGEGFGNRATGFVDALQNWWAAESMRPDDGT